MPLKFMPQKMRFKQMMALNVFLVAVFGLWVSLSHYFNEYPEIIDEHASESRIFINPPFTEDDEDEPMLVDLGEMAMDTAGVSPP